MLDIRLIRERPAFVRERLATRDPQLASAIDEILLVDLERRSAETRFQQLQGERKRISKEIGMRRAKGEETNAVEAEARAMGDEIAALEEQARQFDARQRELLLEVPNLPHADCPRGSSAQDNPVVRPLWGEKTRFDFTPKSHVELGAQHRLFDFERAAKIAGAAFVCLTGAGARLERALINFLLDLHTREHGYEETMPPLLVRPQALTGTTQLPKFGEQLYYCERDNLYLAPTAEVPVTNLAADELKSADELPLRYVACTPCFRREAGAAGLGTRGLIRMHQFDKVELVKIVRPETSFAELDGLLEDAERALQRLGLHYRVIELCTGDIGFGATKTYDIEVWAPGQPTSTADEFGQYLEVSSCSNFGDFQARRMNLRFKGEDGKNQFCHTLNGSGTALPRLFVALIETYQQADGTILIPEPLRTYFGSDRIG